MRPRHFSFIDKLIGQIDQGLRAISGAMPAATRENPVELAKKNPLSEQERKQVISLLRVDHSGEVCAQALYQGQALTTRSKQLQQQLNHAAVEENDHLHWCQQRLKQLNGRVSYLNPLWHFGALSLGMIAGIAGDKWNLGFLAETERQVVKHLDNHLQQLPAHDEATHRLLEQMRADEEQHAHTAEVYGAAELPKPIKIAMQFSSKIMTTIAYYF